MLPSVSHLQGKCLLFKEILLFVSIPISVLSSSSLTGPPHSSFVRSPNSPPLNRLSKLRTPQAWKKLYTHDNVFHRSKQQTSGHYIHKVVLANIMCILTNNGLPKRLVDQEIRDILCGPLLYRRVHWIQIWRVILYQEKWELDLFIWIHLDMSTFLRCLKWVKTRLLPSWSSKVEALKIYNV